MLSFACKMTVPG